MCFLYLLCFLCFLCLLCVPARAQFQGYWSPQTVGPITCINAATVPTTSSATPGAASFILNLGQSVHYVTWTTSGTITFSIQLDGSFVGGTNPANWFRISETGTVSGSGAIWANVYYPFLRCNLTAASGGGSITAIYTGTSVTAGPPTGLFNASGIFTKILATSALANQNATYTTSLPSGTTGGTLYIVNAGGFAATDPANGTLTVSAGVDSSHLAVISTFQFASGTAQQSFNIPPVAASLVSILYTRPSGQPANTYDLSYSFGTVGMPIILSPSSSSLFSCTNHRIIAYTGAGPLINKIINEQSGRVIRICHLSIAFNAATDLQIVYGAGANCATPPSNAITGHYSQITAIVLDFGPFAALDTNNTPNTGICINTTNGTMSGGGVIIYAQF